MDRLPPDQRRLYRTLLAVGLAACLLAGLAAFLLHRAARLSFSPVATGCVAAVCTMLACAAAGAVLWRAERERRRQVAALAERLDLILRDVRAVQSFDDYEEGELAVLANELQKVCTLLRDQAGDLERERDLLADSLADIAHQLRTPLMSLNLTLELLGRPGTPPERQRGLIRELRRTSEQMGWLVTSLLTLARADAGALRFANAPVDAAELLEKAVEPLRIAFELGGRTLVVDCAPGMRPFEGDEGWTREAVANVVKNCLEHTPAGGTVRVEAVQDVFATRITVSDTGPGISARDLPHVFERFYKGEGSSPGSAGIGLALARCLVTSQGGTLTAGNGPRGGARFSMVFPHLRTV